MRHIVPSLALCAAMLPAADPTGGLDRVVRTQEGLQRVVAAQAEQAAGKADLMADELRYNRLGDDVQADRLDQVAVELATLVRSPDGDLKTMTFVVDRLVRARRGDNRELATAASAQSELVDKLDRLARNAQGRLAAANGLEDLRAAIANQRRLLEGTGKLADQTLGKEKSELSTAEKSDQEKLTRQQKNVEKALAEAAESLLEQAKNAENERDRQNLEAAAKELGKGLAAKESEKAADALHDNRLAEAQQAQEKALDILEEAERKAAGATRDPLAALDKRMQDLAKAQREQQALLDESKAEKDLSKTEADRLAARQQDIARKLQELNQQSQPQSRLQQAQEKAQQAQQEMSRQDKAKAEQSMQQALQEMQQAQQQMQQQMRQMQAELDAQRQQSAEQQLARLEQDAKAMQKAQEQQQALLDKLKAQQELDPTSAKELSKDQQQIAQQMQQQKQPSAQKAAQQAKQSLDQQQKQQAEKQMQQALQAMQQAQQQMQQLIQKLKQSQIAQGGSGSASRAEEGPGQLEEGERNSKRPSTWQVGLEPQEREVLSQVKAEAFPSRYEQALVQYYRALAGEADK